MADRTARTPLDRWIAGKVRGRDGLSFVSRDDLDRYHLEKLREAVDYAKHGSPFYGRLLKGLCGSDLSSLDDVASVPFTTAQDIKDSPLSFLCVSQDEIARVVTLSTSGTTGTSKRLFFTAEDLELTIDFFHHGMSTLVSPGQRVLILLPGEKRDSVGDLLKRGLARMNVEGIVHGPVRDVDKAVSDITEFSVDCLVGIPTQVLWIARTGSGAIPQGRIKSVLLSTDYVPQAIVNELEGLWGCPVFSHYGMTETGLGCAVECAALSGYHIREADFYVEIVDPGTGRACSDGQAGEIVFTTLTRKGMPLIRYRTGDICHFMTGPCSCGTALRRLGRVGGRLEAGVPVGRGHSLTIPDLDEALFPVPGLVNYSAELVRGDGNNQLLLSLYTGTVDGGGLAKAARRAAMAVPAVHEAVTEGSLEVPLPTFTSTNPFTTGVGKRRIEVRTRVGTI
ncbi:MAG: AMP-binding protein [Syntrophorhabdaceae bacterium]|nr:AMP-binding protein [Syntrophorhabdaceae bacterium]